MATGTSLSARGGHCTYMLDSAQRGYGVDVVRSKPRHFVGRRDYRVMWQFRIPTAVSMGLCALSGSNATGDFASA